MIGVRDINMLYVLDVQNGERTLFNGQEPQEYKVQMTVPSLEDIEIKYGLKTYLRKDFERFLQKRNMK